MNYNRPLVLLNFRKNNHQISRRSWQAIQMPSYRCGSKFCGIVRCENGLSQRNTIGMSCRKKANLCKQALSY